MSSLGSNNKLPNGLGQTEEEEEEEEEAEEDFWK